VAGGKESVYRSFQNKINEDILYNI